jgi:single-strand DNA-binding protein
VAKFSLAIPDKFNPRDREKTYWANVVAWQKTAEICAKYLTKGSEVIVEGRLTRSSWTKDGVKHSRDEVVVDSVEFCGAGKKQAEPEEEDDIPF